MTNPTPNPASPIVLASSSPRRRDLFARLRIPCELATADVDEWAIPYSSPREFALKAAYAKASAVAGSRPRSLVVGVDTIVVLDGEVFGKPRDEDEACAMLGRLAGRAHTVISGIALVESGGSSLLDAVESRVTLRPLTPAEIREYVRTGEPMDKAGAYAIQGLGGTLIAGIAGDFFNVVGLPVKRLLDMLDSFAETAPFRARIPELVATYPRPAAVGKLGPDGSG